MASQEAGTISVKVVPDVSGIEPAVRAELARIRGLFPAEVGRHELADVITEAHIPPELSNAELADFLIDKFVILRRLRADQS